MHKKLIAAFVVFTLLVSMAGAIDVPMYAAGLEAELFDDLIKDEALFREDLSTTENLNYANSKQTNLTDRTRMFKISDETPDLDENTYVTYSSDHEMTGFTVVAGSRKTKGEGIYTTAHRFEVSEDGVNFAPFTEFETDIPTPDKWSKDMWREVTLRSTAALPENTHYLRIYIAPTRFLGVASSNVMVQMSSVRIACLDTSSEAALTALAAQVRQTLSGAEEGDQPGMYPSDAFALVETALDAVDAILADVPSSTVDQRKAAYQALEDALTAFLEAVIPPDKNADECGDFSKVFEKSGDIAVVTDTPELFGNDAARFARQSSLTGECLVYKAEEATAFSGLEVNAWYKKAGGRVSGDLRIEAAPLGSDPADDTAFEAVSVGKTIENEAGWADGEWRLVRFAASMLPTGTEYVRVTFGDSSSLGDAAAIQIGSVVWTADESGPHAMLEAFAAEVRQMLSDLIGRPETYPPEAFEALYQALDAAEALLDSPAADNELKTAFKALSDALRAFEGTAEAPKRYVDECADFTKVYARSSSDITAANTSPEKFEGDDSRFSRSSKMTGEYVIYQAGEGRRFSSFEVNAWYNKYSNKIPEDLVIEAAPSGADPMNDASYTAVEAVKTIKNGNSWPNDGWRLNTFAVSALPPNTEFVRVTFGDSSNTGKSWTIQIGSMVWEEAPLDYRVPLLPLIERSNELLNDVAMGDGVNMCPEAPYNALLNAKTNAEAVYNRPEAAAQQLMEAYETLDQAVAAFEDAIIRALNWPEGAVLITEAAETQITLKWPHVVEVDADVTYHIYQNGEQAGTTKENEFAVENLKQDQLYSFHVIARKNSDESKMLGPVSDRTLRYGDLPAPDFSRITPEDFEDEDYIAPLVWANDTRGVPYYYYNLHKILNGVRMEEPNKGLVDIFVVRQVTVLNPFNSRLQEVYLPITYFYTRNSDWNAYYGSEEVKIRLEAILEHLLSLQNSHGSFSEYSGTADSLAGTDFNANYLGQMMRLLREAQKADPDFPSIDPDLFNRVDQAVRKALMFVLTNGGMWSHGSSFTNQYGLVWSAALAYLEYHPEDTELMDALKTKWAKSGELISPAGFYIEDSGMDMPYNLGVHIQNIAAEYHYMKDTEFEADLIDHQSRFIDWLSYNLVLEPDGSWFTTNAAASKRSEPSSVVFYRKDIPLAEKIPLARAFVRSEGDIEDEIKRNKEAITKNGAWPNLPEMTTTGGGQYNPYSVYNRILYQYYPTDEERQEAIDMLPYNAKEYFTQQRTDRNFTFSFIRRPSYYTTFNVGPKKIESQCFGLGLLWHPEGGTFLANYGESKKTKLNDYPNAFDYAWGTKAFKTTLSPDHYRVYENKAIDPVYTLNGERFTPTGAISDLPEGELQMEYQLGDVGTKSVRYLDDAIEVEVTHPGTFLECFPVMSREEDKVELFGDRFRIVRGRTVFEITFDREVEFNFEKKGYVQDRLTLHQLTAKSRNELKYTIRMYTREPELREPGSVVQVQPDDAITNPSTNDPAAWEELNLAGDVTRAQYISAVVEAMGMVGDPKKYKNFVDVPTDAWYRESVLTAVQLGLIVGVDDTHFAPDQIINKEQRALILNRAKDFLTGKFSLVGRMLTDVE